MPVGHAVDDVVLAGKAVVDERIAAVAADREQDRNLAHALRHLQIRVRAVVEDAHRLQAAVAAHAVVEIELVDRRIGQRRVRDARRVPQQPSQRPAADLADRESRSAASDCCSSRRASR